MNERKAFPQSLQTERLLLRRPQPGDGVTVNAAIRETYDDLHQWMAWADHVPLVEETEENLCRAGERFEKQEDFPLAVFLKGTGEFVGMVGFHPRDWNVPKFEIGYWCCAAHQGKGYMTEAVRAIAQIGFDGMGANRLEIQCDVQNHRSRKVAERAGFRLEATLKNEDRTPDGMLRDTCIYALFPAEG